MRAGSEKVGQQKHMLKVSTHQEPMFTKETMPDVAPTLQCVISLTFQYFVIYTCLAILRTANQFMGHSLTGYMKIMETAATTVTYAPMLSVLFWEFVCVQSNCHRVRQRSTSCHSHGFS